MEAFEACNHSCELLASMPTALHPGWLALALNSPALILRLFSLPLARLLFHSYLLADVMKMS